MDKNVSYVRMKNLCLGCGACSAVCPSGAIKIVLDKRIRSYVPQVDRRKCTNCGLCRSICPSLNWNLDNDCLKESYEYYVAKSLDLNILKEASSGGVVTSFLIHLIKNRHIEAALLVRSNSSKPYPFLAKNTDDILACMGSKYCPVPLCEKTKDIIRSDLKKIAIVGLPCQIQAIENIKKTSPNLRRKELIYLGLFCSRLPNFKATDYLLTNLLKINKENVKAINYRKGYNAQILLKNNKVIKIPYKKYWNSDFKYLINRRCLFCYDRVNELADISFGDYWLGKKNIIIVRNKKYGNLLKKSGVVDIHSIGIDKVHLYLDRSINFKKNLLEAKVKLFAEKDINIKNVKKSKFVDYIYSLLFILKYKIRDLTYKK